MKITGVKAIPCQGGMRTWTFVKVTTDEGITGWGDASEWVRVQAHCKVIEEDLAALAEAYHLPVIPHNPNSPLSTIISGTVAATLPNFLALEYYPIEREPPWRDLVTVPSLGSFVKDGYLELPTGPGWGVELDEAEIAKHPYQEVWYSRVVGSDVAGLTTA